MPSLISAVLAVRIFQGTVWGKHLTVAVDCRNSVKSIKEDSG